MQDYKNCLTERKEGKQENMYTLNKNRARNNWERERESVCVWERESVCVCERERVCVCEREREREREWEGGGGGNW